MSLRELAAADAQSIVQNSEEFGWPLTVTSPNGESAALVGLSTDIGLTIDPETGTAVSGRQASVVLSIASLTEASLGLPRGMADSGGKPWLVRFADLQGQAQTFKVARTMVDRAVGLVSCILEAYRE